MQHCPLCKFQKSTLFCKDSQREFLKCERCSLVYVPDNFLPDEETEKSRYLEHNNSIDDHRYVYFLSKSLLPTLSLTTSTSRILDFGSGPEPVLSTILLDMGLTVDKYDPFFNKNNSVFQKTYDIIISTEVFEHIFNLHSTVAFFCNMLTPGSSCIIQTALYPDTEIFQNWYYKNDITHTRFFSDKTLQWMSLILRADLSIPEPQVAVFTKY